MEIKQMAGAYHSYLRDESRLGGTADYIVFPEDTAEAAGAIHRALSEGWPLTVQGSRTGITGGAVPGGGLVLSTEKMNRPLGCRIDEQGRPILRVQAGMSFADLSVFLGRGLPGADWTAESVMCFEKLKRQGKYRFPPKPTESSASLGGAFAVNAKGPNSLRYGRTADHVVELTWLTPPGKIWEIKRGDYQFDSSGCSLPDGTRLRTDTAVPEGATVFLNPFPGLDLVDFLAGSEGLAGIIAGLGLGLQPVPAVSWAVIFFFTIREAALDFAEDVFTWKKNSRAGTLLSSFEYYGDMCLELIRERAAELSSLRQLPPVNPEYRAAIHAEFEGTDSESLEAGLMELLEIFVRHGGAEENTWAAADSGELEKYWLLRHGVPELINTEIDRIRQTVPGFYKTAADFMVPREKIRDWTNRYHADIAESQLRGFVFGHIMEGHLHVNLLAENEEESRRCLKLLDAWAVSVMENGGLLAAESGIGRLKKNLVSRFLKAERLAQIRGILSQLDPQSLLGGFDKSGQGL